MSSPDFPATGGRRTFDTPALLGGDLDGGDRSRELELELRRVRAAARAARLEARVAELELMLRQNARRERTPPPAEAVERLAINDWQELLQAAVLPDENELPQPPPQAALDRRHQVDTKANAHANVQAIANAIASAIAGGAGATVQARGPGPAAPEAAADVASDGAESRRAEAAAPPAGSVGDNRLEGEGVNDRSLRAPAPPKDRRVTPMPIPASEQKTTDRRLAPKPLKLSGRESKLPRVAPLPINSGTAVAEVSEGDAAGTPRRFRRPAAWIVSSVAHAAVLLMLALMTISVADPRDQIALQASTVEPSEATVETVVFEQLEQPEPTAPQSPVHQLADLSPIGTIAASEIEIETPELRTPSTGPLDSLSKRLSAGGAMSANLSAEATSEFFGAEGGGNHFVYLVDNSGSMASVADNGFDVARRELLKSIDALQEDQRFYVIFFGEKMLRMRIDDPAAPEPRSIYATDENKAAIRRWAMGITMQPGRWPEKPLEFAFELRPDVIFLLTDGEMSQRVEPMIREHNLVESLFEGPHPRSIIHTIGFYSRDGAEQMQTIARVNGGQYHFVPPPAR